MPQTPILWSFRRCPYAMRARLAIKASGVRVELREILLRDKPAAMLEASPKGTVPVLETGAGVTPSASAISLTVAPASLNAISFGTFALPTSPGPTFAGVRFLLLVMAPL